MSGELDGMVAVVTGAGSAGPVDAAGIGIGRAAAVLLARDGARVAVLDRLGDSAKETAEMVNAGGGEARAVEVDVADEESIKVAVGRIVDAWGRIDILVNNVGTGGPRADATELAIADFDATVRVNVSSMIMMAKHVIPHMRAAGAGAIVNISSVAGLRGGHPSLAYATTKGAVVNMTRAMAAHHGRDGIRVNCVAPGMVSTPAVPGGGMTPVTRDAHRGRPLLQVVGTGWDVGEAVRFLAGKRSRWITGVILPVDAGATAGRADSPVPATKD